MSVTKMPNPRFQDILLFFLFTLSTLSKSEQPAGMGPLMIEMARIVMNKKSRLQAGGPLGHMGEQSR